MATVKNTEAPSFAPSRVVAGDDLEASHARSGQAATSQRSGGSAWTLWLWVAAGFLALTVAWTILFAVARSAKVESVPLATKEAKP